MPLVTRAMFARITKVTPSCVWNWVHDGKIDGDAVSGTGRGLRIDVDRALEQLKRRLSIDESVGLNGIGTDLGDGGDGSTVELIRQEKLRHMRLDTVEKEKKAKALDGGMISIEEHRRAFALASDQVPQMVGPSSATWRHRSPPIRSGTRA